MEMESGAQTNSGERPLGERKWPRVIPQPWMFHDFPIAAWWPPPGSGTLDDFIRYRDAGFNLYPVNGDTHFHEAMELSRRAGLSVIAFHTYQDLQGTPAPIDWDRAVKEHPHLVGWITHDIPDGHGMVCQAIDTVNALMREDPSRWAFFNLFPPRKQRGPATPEIVAAAVEAGMPILSYYDYVMMADGRTRTEENYRNLDLFRQASVRHNVPFWAFALTIRHWGYRRPSQSDVRWKQFTNLAFGAKGLWYFTYWAPRGWKDWDDTGIVDACTGQPTDLYHWVREINQAVRAAGPVLLDLKNVGIAHVPGADGRTGLVPGDYWIEAAIADDLTIGFFEDSAGMPYCWLVNNRHGMGRHAACLASEVSLALAARVKGVEAVCWLDGHTGPLPVTHRTVRLRIAGGTGVLLRARLA